MRHNYALTTCAKSLVQTLVLKPVRGYNISKLNKTSVEWGENTAWKTEVPTTTGGPTSSLITQEV